VRRMAKLNNRKANAQAAQPHLGAGSPVVQALPSSAGIGLGLKGPPNLLPNSAAQLQHHHHQPNPEGPQAPAANGEDDMGAMLQQHHHNGQPSYGSVPQQLTSATNSRSSSGHLSPAVGGSEGYANGQNHHPHHPGPTSGSDIRPRHVFHGYPTSYPTENVAGSSMPASMHDGMDPMGPPSNAPNAVATSSDASPSGNTALFGDIPDHKRRPHARDSRFVPQVELGLPPLVHLVPARSGGQFDRDSHPDRRAYARRQ